MSSNDKFLFFYGHHNGDEACLSNWYLAPFKDPELDNLEFSTNEKYMMYRKALLFKDKKSAKKILCSNDPKECKSLGRKVKKFNEETWEKHRVEIVRNGCYLKFSQNKKLKKFLLGTKGKVLVEASRYDKIWGIGMTEKEANGKKQEEWKGLNLLGQCLMEARTMIKDMDEL